jgi:beta-glucanase (GH16 family)
MPGSNVTLFATGMGPVAPSIGDGQFPLAPFPAPAHPWSVSFGGIAAQPCASTFAGLVYSGVTQINACVPDGVPRTANVPITLVAGGVQSPSAAIDLQSAWRVIWSDEFNGPAGAPVDPKKWTFDTGAGGWGNNELETYTNSTENVFQDGSGNLVIRALKTGANSYTSGRIKTQGKFDFQYGRAEARIKIPYGQGIWPAFWMLGNDIDRVGWPECGEIDIMENVGKEPSTIHGTVHGPGYSGSAGIGGPYALPAGKRFADDFHVYAVEWSPQSVAFFVDGAKYFEVTPARLPAGKTWAYQHPFFLILNVAVGGMWPGNPDPTTTFPQQMLVDWVRVSQRL